MRKSVELVKKFTVAKNIDENLIYDQFGFFDKDVPSMFKTKRPPIKDYSDFIEAMKDRAKELGKFNLAWSGGIDSTLILAVCKSVGVEVNPIWLTDVNPLNNETLVNYVRDNFNLQTMTTEEFLSSGEFIYNGAGADDLFNCIAIPPRNIIIFNYANGKKEYSVLTEEIDDEQELKSYGEYLGVAIRTNLDALRVVTLGCRFWHNNYSPIKNLGDKTKSFFDTERFMDIAFTQYFDRQCLIDPPKAKEKEFIKNVFGNDFDVEKN